MNPRKVARRQAPGKVKESEAVIRALKTHQVDAIVGERHVMVVRLNQAERELERSRDQLRALAARLQSIREIERTGIAREVHDEFGQTLTSLQLGLAWMARNSTAGPQTVKLKRKVASLSEMVTTMIQSVRRIAAKLRPGALDELGLVSTLRSEAREFQEHTGIRCRFETNFGKATFERLGSVAVFRIVQAALTNVARHAQASKAKVVLRKQKHNLVLTVQDNGKGILKQQVSSHGSLGLIGMRERALAFDGELTLRGSKRSGTVLTVRIPLSRVVAAKAS